MYVDPYGSRKRRRSSDITNHYPARRFVRNDVFGIEFKSSMEANYARFLTQRCKGLKWYYEKDKFNFPKGTSRIGVRAYIPDFKVISGKHIWYVEVKGVPTHIDHEKMRLMASLYPWVKIYLLTTRGYNIIKKQHAASIKGWEY